MLIVEVDYMVAIALAAKTGFSAFLLKHIQDTGAPAQSTRFVIPFVRRNSELSFARLTRVLSFEL